jgi:alpha-soluble NSF attachment protein
VFDFDISKLSAKSQATQNVFNFDITKLKQNEEADKLVQAAEKRLNTFHLFKTKEMKREDAIELYIKAYTKYVYDTLYAKAANCAHRISELYELLDDQFEALEYMTKEANMTRKFDNNKAVELYSEIGERFIENGSFTRAAKMYSEAADICKKDNENDLAIKYYKRVIEALEADNKDVSEHKTKIGELYINEKQYYSAKKLYDEILKALDSKNAIGMRFNKYVFLSVLCDFAINIQSNKLDETKDLLSRSADRYPSFSHERMFNLLGDCLDAASDGDTEKFSQILASYDTITPLESYQINTLNEIKKVIENCGNQQEAIDLR